MAISDRIRNEARRTIEEIEKYYATYGDIGDADEREHRIARVEASMEGCNGLSQDDKIQKTAENVFELTCAQERSYDSLRKELKLTRSEYREEFKALKKDLKEGLKDISQKIEASGCDGAASASSKEPKEMGALVTTIAKYPLMSFVTFIIIVVLSFVSGHFSQIIGALNK